MRGSTSLSELKQMDANIEDSLQLNSNYQLSILSTMKALADSNYRLDDLQSITSTVITNTISTNNNTSPYELKVISTGTQSVTLPWFKYFHGQDLPKNNDGIARDSYLKAIRVVPC